MNRLTAYILILLNGIFIQLLYAQDHGHLHLNKHYFTSGEDIYFSFYLYVDKENAGKTGNAGLEDLLTDPVYAALLEITRDNQVLKDLVKLHWNENRTGGYLRLADNLNTGQYIIGIFTFRGLEKRISLSHRSVYVFNPEAGYYQEPDLSGDMGSRDNQSGYIKTGSTNNDEKLSVNSGVNTTIQYDLRKSTAGAEDILIFNGQVLSGDSSPSRSYLSVSVVDIRFYNDAGLYSFSTRKPLSYDKITEGNESDPDETADNRYIHGQLMIDGEPASIKKLYFYAYKNGRIILDKYITSRNGEFWFLEAPFSDQYTIKLLTFPEKDKNYSFRLLSDQVTDSIFHLDPVPYQLVYREAYRNHALKKYLIDRSYLEVIRDSIKDTRSSRLSIDAEPSHEIVLDNYIHFSTLPEIIREIVPQVSIKYKNEHYEIRIYDSRARNYCCEENPLLFVNTEPFMDIDPVMEINTNEIYSIEVIRPIEAIRAFGDIGVNGILKINLHPDVKEPEWPSDGKVTFQIPGYQGKEQFHVPEHPGDYPDFRSFLFWDGEIQAGEDGKFQFQFKPSKLTGEFLIVIRGITSDGHWISEEIEFKPGNINP